MILYSKNGQPVSPSLTRLAPVDVRTEDYVSATDAHGIRQGFYILNNSDDDVKISVVPYDNDETTGVVNNFQVNAHSVEPIIFKRIKANASVAEGTLYIGE